MKKYRPKQIVLKGWQLRHLIQDLAKWEHWEREYYDHLSDGTWTGWKRSPIKRENRRESIVYGNCLSSMLMHLRRRSVNRLAKEFGVPEAREQGEKT